MEKGKKRKDLLGAAPGEVLFWCHQAIEGRSGGKAKHSKKGRGPCRRIFSLQICSVETRVDDKRLEPGAGHGINLPRRPQGSHSVHCTKTFLSLLSNDYGSCSSTNRMLKMPAERVGVPPEFERTFLIIGWKERILPIGLI